MTIIVALISFLAGVATPIVVGVDLITDFIGGLQMSWRNVLDSIAQCFPWLG